MRWDHLRLDGIPERGTTAGERDADAGDGTAGLAGAGCSGTAVPPALFELGAQGAQCCSGAPRAPVARTFDTPGFRGMTFYEVHAKSIINRVPPASRVPFRWTINPYRGCQHACFLLLCPEHAHVPGS